MTSINSQNEVAFFHKIHDRRNDGHEFGEYIDLAINCRFLCPWDVLIADNAKYHFYGDNRNLIDYLWEHHRIFVLLLPVQTPEWNPVELIWALLVQRMGRYPLHSIRSIGEHMIAHVAHDILSKITFDEVLKTYEFCYSA